MKAMTLEPFITPKSVEEFAMKNYKTYVEHYKARKLKPMSLQDFLKNYIS